MYEMNLLIINKNLI